MSYSLLTFSIAMFEFMHKSSIYKWVIFQGIVKWPEGINDEDAIHPWAWTRKRFKTKQALLRRIQEGVGMSKEGKNTWRAYASEVVFTYSIHFLAISIIIVQGSSNHAFSLKLPSLAEDDVLDMSMICIWSTKNPESP